MSDRSREGEPVVVLPDADALAREAAERIVAAARESIAARGRFVIALAGGSTPEKAYRLLSGAEYAARIDWERIFIFWGDERFVPRTDERSNYHLAESVLLNKVPVPPQQIFPVATELPTVEDAARAYGETLQTTLGDPIPVFDLILLGLGDDGHTASLFPGMPSLKETERSVIASPPGVLPPPVDRVTFTFPVLNAAHNVVFLISGEKKAESVRRLIKDAPDPQQTPATGVQPSGGALFYLLDQAAAQLLDSASK